MQKIVYAKMNNCLISAQKVRLVADLIRGKSTAQAKDILTFTNKSAAKDLIKVLDSAVANCVHNENYDKNSLMVKEVMIDVATTYKRGRAVSRGRNHEILKRNSHIKLGLISKDAKETIAPKAVKEVKEKAVKTEVKAEKKTTAKKVSKNLSKKVVKK